MVSGQLLSVDPDGPMGPLQPVQVRIPPGANSYPAPPKQHLYCRRGKDCSLHAGLGFPLGYPLLQPSNQSTDARTLSSSLGVVAGQIFKVAIPPDQPVVVAPAVPVASVENPVVATAVPVANVA